MNSFWKRGMTNGREKEELLESMTCTRPSLPFFVVIMMTP